MLSYNELIGLIDDGVINAKRENVNGASIDITLGNTIRVESCIPHWPVVDLMEKEVVSTSERDISIGSYVMQPGEAILAESVEVFNLPNDITADYLVKSSMARCFLNHALAGHCDPGWHGSVLTLELFNQSRYHRLKLTAGMKIGQVEFFRVDPVPNHASYATVGQYNNSKTVTESGGLR